MKQRELSINWNWFSWPIVSWCQHSEKLYFCPFYLAPTSPSLYPYDLWLWIILVLCIVDIRLLQIDESDKHRSSNIAQWHVVRNAEKRHFFPNLQNSLPNCKLLDMLCWAQILILSSFTSQVGLVAVLLYVEMTLAQKWEFKHSVCLALFSSHERLISMSVYQESSLTLKLTLQNNNKVSKLILTSLWLKKVISVKTSEINICYSEKASYIKDIWYSMDIYNKLDSSLTWKFILELFIFSWFFSLF